MGQEGAVEGARASVLVEWMRVMCWRETRMLHAQVLWQDSLPRTASNKVMRRLLRDELRSSHSRL